VKGKENWAMTGGKGGASKHRLGMDLKPRRDMISSKKRKAGVFFRHDGLTRVALNIQSRARHHFGGGGGCRKGKRVRHFGEPRTADLVEANGGLRPRFPVPEIQPRLTVSRRRATLSERGWPPCPSDRTAFQKRLKANEPKDEARLPGLSWLW
jgi:hypothetical protein